MKKDIQKILLLVAVICSVMLIKLSGQNSVSPSNNLTFSEVPSFIYYEGDKFKEFSVDGMEKISWEDESSSLLVYPELANGVCYVSCFSQEQLKRFPIDDKRGFFQGVYDEFNKKWVILEKEVSGNAWTLFLLDEETEGRINLISNTDYPEGFGFKPIAWVNNTTILIEGLYFGSTNENQGIWKFNLTTRKISQLPLSEKYNSTPLISSDNNYLIYVVGQSSEDKLHAEGNEIRLFDLMNNQEHSLFSSSENVKIICWSLKKNHPTVDNFPMTTFMTPALYFPWAGGQTKCITRTVLPLIGTACINTICSTPTSTHSGFAIDFALSLNENIITSAYGTVIFAGFGTSGSGAGGYGNAVKIRHTDNTIAYYGHMNRIGVKVNDVLNKGCIIGKVGQTGCSTNLHLHVEVRDVMDNQKLILTFSDCSNNSIPRAGYYSTSGNIQPQNCTSNFNLNCSSPINISCGQSYSGTSNGKSTIANYGCNSWNDPGPEKVHRLVHNGGTFTASLSNVPSGVDLDVFILNSCNSTNCVGVVSSTSATYTNAPAGTYYIVVDGAGTINNNLYTCTTGNHYGHHGSYTLTVTCGSICPTPTGVYAQSITATSVTLNWTSSNAITYNYYLKKASQSSYTPYPNYPYKPVSFSNLLPNTTYNFKVSSNCSGSTSLQSSVYTFTTYSFRIGEEVISVNDEVKLSDGSSSSNPKDIFFDINIYPNPSSNIFKIEYADDLKQNGNLKIFNPLGQTVYASDIKNETGQFSKEINLENASSGVYFIKMQIGETIINRKISIER